jgi:predicted nucleic acid-binding protein
MRETLVVANSSPFIALERIGHLHLLPALIRKVLIPPAVRREVFGSKPLPDWVEEKSLQQPLAPRMTATRLGPGEREAIALALELGADVLILDDLPARRLAISLGIPVIGTLGLLLRAKRRGLIPQVLPLMEELQEQDFHISERLFSGMLAAAGEDDLPGE